MNPTNRSINGVRSAGRPGPQRSQLTPARTIAQAGSAFGHAASRDVSRSEQWLPRRFLHSGSSKIQVFHMLEHQTNGFPLPFRRGEGQGEGLLVDMRLHGEELVFSYRIHEEASPK